jgi:hypothetical protein
MVREHGDIVACIFLDPSLQGKGEVHGNGEYFVRRQILQLIIESK